MQSRLRYIIAIPLVAALLAPAGVPDAQFGPEPLALTASPETPSPGQQVVVEASTPTFEKNAALFEWTFDGVPKPDQSGVGKNAFRYDAPARVGAVNRVGVLVTPLGNERIRASLDIIVADLVLSWVARTYTPKWYRGKALPVQSSEVDVIAVPHVVLDGRAILPENLVYRWSVDGGRASEGTLGQQTFRIRTSFVPNVQQRIRVSVEDVEQRILKQREIFITPTIPHTAIYAASPLGGIEPRFASPLYALATRGLLDFISEPFFFTARSRRNLRYEWNVGGRSVRGRPENPSLLTVDASSPRLRQAQVLIGVTVNDLDELIPAATKFITLELPSP